MIPGAARAAPFVAIGPHDPHGIAQAPAHDAIDEHGGGAVVPLPATREPVAGHVRPNRVVGDLRAVRDGLGIVGFDVARVGVQERPAAVILEAVRLDGYRRGHTPVQAAAGRAVAAHRAGHVGRVVVHAGRVADRQPAAEVQVRGPPRARVVHHHRDARAVEAVGRIIDRVRLGDLAVRVVDGVQRRQRRFHPLDRVVRGKRLDCGHRQPGDHGVDARHVVAHLAAVRHQGGLTLGDQVDVRMKDHVQGRRLDQPARGGLGGIVLVCGGLEHGVVRVLAARHLGVEFPRQLDVVRRGHARLCGRPGGLRPCGNGRKIRIGPEVVQQGHAPGLELRACRVGHRFGELDDHVARAARSQHNAGRGAPTGGRAGSRCSPLYRGAALGGRWLACRISSSTHQGDDNPNPDRSQGPLHRDHSLPVTVGMIISGNGLGVNPGSCQDFPQP